MPPAMTLDEQLAFLAKGAVDLIERNDLKAKLSLGEPLSIKVGLDPTAPDINLGHTVVMRKMKHFQQLGHRVICLIGDFTGMIGDPTGKKATRPPLTTDEILQNAETYKQQVFKILDPVKTEVLFNSEWLGALDSVALKCDVEMGGTDQLFNLLVGRDLMREYGLEPQIVLTMPLLEGLDGVEKMSKSLGNYIGINEEPSSIFGKIMSISDDLMWKYYVLCTDLTATQIAQIKKAKHPMDAKKDLAKIIIRDFHDADAAEVAEAEFRRVFSEGQAPTEIEERS